MAEFDKAPIPDGKVEEGDLPITPRTRRSRNVGPLTEEERTKRMQENQEELMKELEAITGIQGHDEDGTNVLEKYERFSLAMDEFMFEDDEEFDSDEEGTIWFCINCTVQNYEAMEKCRGCNEHRYSEIIQRGYLADPNGPQSSEAGNETLRSNAAPENSELPQQNTGTVIGFDERMLLHEEIGRPIPHPERSDRLRAILASLRESGLYPGRCSGLSNVRQITREELSLVHCERHLDTVDATAGNSPRHFNSDTYCNQHSAEASRIGSGICADMAVDILKNRYKNGVALVRPPGHHAESDSIMGFCLHNHAAVAAAAAMKNGAKKVLILDWDVHHGNGTQEIFFSDPNVLYISLHRRDAGFYPGTGSEEEVGAGQGVGYTVNIPWQNEGVGDADYLNAFHWLVIPLARQFGPDMVIISAGFDAARGDPLGQCDISPDGYAIMTAMLMDVCQGKVLAVLEGGYNLRSISESMAAVVKSLLGDAPPPPSSVKPSLSGAVSVYHSLKMVAQFWPSLNQNFHCETLEGYIVSEKTQRENGDCMEGGSSAGYEEWLAQTSRRQGMKRKVPQGPIWWQTGRKRLVYDAWMMKNLENQVSHGFLRQG